MGKQKNIPALRFPEFTQKWTVKKLKDVTLSIDSGWSPQCEEMPAQKGEWGVLKTTAVVWEGFNENENKKLPIKLIPKPDFEVKINDILITRAGPTNRVGVAVHVNKVRERLMLSDKIIRIRTTKDVSSPFIVISLSNKFAQSQILSKSSGLATSQTNISQNILLNVLLPITDHKEQTKIASFLTAIDDRLQALKKKKALLEQYKKGIMQKIFSQELRFKDNNGEEFPDWEEKSLGDVAKVIMGQSPESSSYNSDKNGMPLIQGNADIQNRISAPRNWTTETTKECQIGDLILTVRAPVGAVAKSVHNACIGRGVCAIRNNDISNIEFIYQFLLDYEPQWVRLEQGSTFTAVSGVDIKSIDFLCPCVAEQTKIANFLSAIDDKINHCQTQIKKTDQFKKGLLQQMFC